MHKFGSRIRLAAAALLGTICLTGCFSLETALTPSGDEHVLVSNYGWYLFHYIPLACGNAAEDPLLPWAFFRNDVTMEKVQSRFAKVAEAAGKHAGELSYSNYEQVLLELPGTNVPLPIPYLVTYREIQLSGVLK